MNNNINTQAEKYLSKVRLHRYAIINKNDQLRAYLNNLAISEKLISMISIFEVILRNKINIILTDEFGNDYLKNKNSGQIFNKKERKMIDAAYKKAAKAKIKIHESKVITELTLGFWCKIIEKHSLWTCCLYKIHPNRKKIKFRNFIKQINLILDIRNKIAHHERIIKKRPFSMKNILAAITNETLLLIDDIDYAFKDYIENYMNTASSAIQRLFAES